MEHEMRLDSSPFERMFQGRKVIEARLTVDKNKRRRKINVGDTIIFNHAKDPSLRLRVQVTALLYYPSFEELINDFDPQRFFGRDTKEELLGNLRRRYNSADEKRYGVLGIKVKKLKDCVSINP